MNTVRQDILNVLKSKEERFEIYISEDARINESEEDVLTERGAIEGMENRGGGFDYNTLAKQYIKSTVHMLLKDKSPQEAIFAYDKAIRSCVNGIKSTFVGNKPVSDETLLAAAQKDPRIAKLLRLNMSQTIDYLKRVKNTGSNEANKKILLRGGPSLETRYAMFEEAVKKICTDQGWVKEFKRSIFGNVDEGFKIEGKTAPKPDPTMKKGRKTSVDTEEGDGDSKSKKKCSIDGASENKNLVSKEEKEVSKKSCDTKKKCSSDTEEKDSKKKKKAWGEVKSPGIFNY